MNTQKIDGVVNMISESINDLSDISRSLGSEVILNNGLIRAIEFEIVQLQKSGLYSLDSTVTGNCIFLDSRKELILFRIVQEALNNIVKHAAATRIIIKLHYDDLFTLDIADNGKGFDVDKTNTNGTGLINMKKRANMLNGKFTIESLPANGTNIKIEIPING